MVCSDFERKVERVSFEASPEPRRLTLSLRTALRKPLGVALVREDVLDVDRRTDVPWAQPEPPPGLTR
jgi:hypothetical protein